VILKQTRGRGFGEHGSLRPFCGVHERAAEDAISPPRE
jgi:hypothetical protein